jgi:hypothetical protein
MKEHIYTIPLNDYFGKLEDCPLCGLFDMMEKNEIETVTGASMMEPSVRIKTNEQGFCEHHFDMMLQIGKRLPIALILQSHMENIYSALYNKKGDNQLKFLTALENDCYVCNRINKNMESVYNNLFYLYKNEQSFAELFSKQKLFCFHHYGELLSYGTKNLSKKEFNIFFETVNNIEMNYLKTLQGDIDWFCKKFDYRFTNEDWKNSKDAIERTVYTLTGKKPEFKSIINTTI